MATKQPLTSLCHAHSGFETQLAEMRRKLDRVERILWGLVGVTGLGAVGAPDAVRAFVGMFAGGQ